MPSLAQIQDFKNFFLSTLYLPCHEFVSAIILPWDYLYMWKLTKGIQGCNIIKPYE